MSLRDKVLTYYKTHSPAVGGEGAGGATPGGGITFGTVAALVGVEGSTPGDRRDDSLAPGEGRLSDMTVLASLTQRYGIDESAQTTRSPPPLRTPFVGKNASSSSAATGGGGNAAGGLAQVDFYTDPTGQAIPPPDVDESGNVRPPSNSSPSVLFHSTWADSDGGSASLAKLQVRGAHDAAAGGEAAPTPPAGGAVISQLVLAHLETLDGAYDAAAAAAARGCGPCVVSGSSTNVVGGSSTSASAGGGGGVAVTTTTFKNVADTLRDELKERGLSERFYSPYHSPIAFITASAPTARSTHVLVQQQLQAAATAGQQQQGGGVFLPSPLTMLLVPAPRTRQLIGLLMTDVRGQILSSPTLSHSATGAGGGQSSGSSSSTTMLMSDAALEAVQKLCEQRMWTEDDETAPHIFYSTPSSSSQHTTQASLAPNVARRIKAASLNQLIEAITSVRYTPHVSTPEAVTAYERELTQMFFATYQHFATPRVVLAKLLERFLMPPCLKLSGIFDSHGIFIKTRSPPSKELMLTGSMYKDAATDTLHKPNISDCTAYFIQITKLIQIKVAVVLAVWCKANNGADFDDLMKEATLEWVDEVCYSPNLWTECPSQLMLAAEVIKGVLRVCGRQKAPNSNSAPPSSSALAGLSASAAAAALSLPPTLRGDYAAITAAVAASSSAAAGGSSSSAILRPKNQTDSMGAAVAARGRNMTLSSLFGSRSVGGAPSSGLSEPQLQQLGDGEGGTTTKFGLRRAPTVSPDVIAAREAQQQHDQELIGGDVISTPTTSSRQPIRGSNSVAAAVAHLLPTMSVDKLQTALTELLEINDEHLAAQLTASEHEALRRVEPFHLFEIAASRSTVHLHNHAATAIGGGRDSSHHPGSYYSSASSHGGSRSSRNAAMEMLHRAEELLVWVVSDILTAGIVDKLLLSSASSGTSAVGAAGGAAGGASSSVLFFGRTVTKFVSLAFRLMEINNFQTACTIATAFQHPALARLIGSSTASHVAQQLPPATVAALDSLKSTFDFGKCGYKRYKELISSAGSASSGDQFSAAGFHAGGGADDDVYPVLPAISVWIDELRLIELHEPSVLRVPSMVVAANTSQPQKQQQQHQFAIHWRKFAVVGHVYEMLRRAQRAPVPLDLVPEEESQLWLDSRLAAATSSSSAADVEKLVGMSMAVYHPQQQQAHQ